MPTPPNLLTRHEIHTRPELWKDKIYYLERNPYWNSSYDFLPIPKKYAEIIQEFQTEVKKQKDLEEAREKASAAVERARKAKEQLFKWGWTNTSKEDFQEAVLAASELIRIAKNGSEAEKENWQKKLVRN